MSACFAGFQCASAPHAGHSNFSSAVAGCSVEQTPETSFSVKALSQPRLFHENRRALGPPLRAGFGAAQPRG